MSERNWISVEGVKLDKEIYDYIVENNLVVLPPPSSAPRSALKGKDIGKVNGTANGIGKVNEIVKVTADDYPWIGYVPELCGLCATRECGCLRLPVKRWLAHFFVYDFYKPGTRKDGKIVHHKNEDKLDARIKNLGLGTRRAHALAHNAKRQKFSKRERHDFGGFRYRPPQPAPVIARPELIGLKVPVEVKQPRPLSKTQRMRELDERLARLWEPLSEQLKGMNSAAPLPRTAPESAWRSAKTWKLGISMPRMELTPGEAAFVLLAVKHGWEFEWMSRDSGEPEELLRLFMKSPAVDLASRHWRSHRRLPLAPEVAAEAADSER